MTRTILMLYNIQLGKCLFFFRVRGEKNSIFRFFFFFFLDINKSHGFIQMYTQDSPAETIEWKCLRNNTRISFLFINAVEMGRCWWTLSVKLFSTYICIFLHIMYLFNCATPLTVYPHALRYLCQIFYYLLNFWKCYSRRDWIAIYSIARTAIKTFIV